MIKGVEGPDADLCHASVVGTQREPGKTLFTAASAADRGANERHVKR
jgi:hypothetical protein